MTSAVSSRLDEIAGLIPGYDPAERAGDCTFDEAAADRVLGFFGEILHHVKGKAAGNTFALEPWERAIVANLYGWKRPDGTRRYREAFIYVPRKNGKTTLVAGLALYMLTADGEPGSEVYSAAADRDQASIVFDVAKGMVLSEPELRSRCRVYPSFKSIQVDDSMSFYRAVSAESGTKHGLNPHLIIVDELHAQKRRDLVDTLMTSLGARDQPLAIFITTADFDRESICNEKHDYAKKVRDGIIDDQSFLPVLYEADKDDDWQDEAVWRRVNPNLGVSISVDYLQRECARAIEQPTYENTFKRLHLNIQTEQDVRWLILDRWDKCGGPLDRDQYKGRQCIGGLDIGSTSDLTALCLLFDAPEDRAGYDLLWWFWTPRAGAEQRERRDRVPYLTWARQGWLELTDGDETDYEHIRRRVNEIADDYPIGELAADRLFQGAQLVQSLAGDGFNVVPFGQGYMSMAAPTVEFEKLVNRAELRHGDNPVMRWMASNVSVEMDAAGNIKPSKRKSTEKIDGVVAAIMAIGRALVRQGDRPDAQELMVV